METQQPTALPQLSFQEALKLNIANITNIKGRSRRSELWWNFLAYMILSFCISLLFGNSNAVLLVIISFLLQLSITPVTIRRMHDVGQSGIWVWAAVAIGVATNVYGVYKGITSTTDIKVIMEFVQSPVFLGLSLASFIVNIVILVFSLMDSKKEVNRYGASPKYV